MGYTAKLQKFRKNAKIFFCALAVFSVFAVSGISWAITSVRTIQIPTQFGTVKEAFDAPALRNSKPTIIHIQDAHCNYEAQKNMAQILDSLVRQYNLKLIMVEGGSGNVNLNFLRSYADKKTRAEVAEKYLQKGEISGEEYLDIISDYNIELYGIEDEALYDSHLEVFNKLDSLRDEGLKYIQAVAGVSNALKPYIYSPQLQELEEQKGKYENKTLGLAEYCRYLKETAAKAGLNVNSWRNLSAFSESARLEKAIDFKQAELERNAFVKDLAKLLDENTVKDLLNKSQDFKAGKITPLQYYSFLTFISLDKLQLKSYPHLESYIRYINLSNAINTQDILNEMSSIEERISEVLFTNDDQKQLAQISKSLALLSDILNLELTPENYQYFQANKSNFSSAFWMDFLTQNCRKYNLALQTPASGVIDDNQAVFTEFYQLGAKREDVFIKNLENKLQESGEKIAVLITGGFHTPGLTKALKEQGYPYIVVTPVITKRGDPNIYLSVLRGEKKSIPSGDDIDEQSEE